MTRPHIQLAGELEPAPEIVAPPTPIQQRFLALQARDPDSPIANIAMRWRLLGAVSDRSVDAALKLLAERHETLRTRFDRGADGPRQAVGAASVRLSLIDLSQLAEERSEAEANRIARLEAQTPFDPAVAPLWRAALLRRSPGEAVLLVTFHHAIADGWSIGVFARELAAAIDALEHGRSPEFPEIELQYADYARWQEAVRASDALAEERRFWRRQMADVQPLDVAPTRTPPVEGRREGEIRSLVLPRDLTDRLQAIARQEGQTMFSLACAGLTAALARAWGRTELVLGTQVAGRDDPLLFGVIGPVVNTVLLRVDTAAVADVWTHARNVRGVVADALANKALPFDDIVAGTRLSTLAGLPLGYCVNVTLQAANIDTDDVGSIRHGGVELVSIPSVTAGCLYDLSFFMVGREEGWRISCEHNTDRHRAAAVDDLLAAWRREIEALVETPPRRAAAPAAAPPAVACPLLRQPSRCYFQPVALQAEGRLPPVFALSNRSLYYPITERIAGGRPFIDLQWREDAKTPPLGPDSIPDIAADAARRIREVDPRGPYYLVSFCLMGNVAFETAQQLRDAGSEVKVLFLLDTVAPGYVEGMSRRDRLLRRLQLADRVVTDLKARIRKVRAGEMSIGAALSQYSIVRNTPLAGLAQRLGWIAPAGNATDDFMNHGLMDYLLDARAHYRYRPYQGDVVYFRAADARVGRLFARSFGWSDIVKGDLRVYDVPGAHLEMTRDPGARVIAEHMAWTLDRVEGRWRMPPPVA